MDIGISVSAPSPPPPFPFPPAPLPPLILAPPRLPSSCLPPPHLQPRRDHEHHEQGGGAGLRKLDFRFYFKLLLNSGETDIVLVTLPSTAVEAAILRSTLVAAQWRGDTTLTLPLFWRRSTASSVFRVGARGRAFTLSPPSLPPPPPPRPPPPRP